MSHKLHFDWSDLPQLIAEGMLLREIARMKGCSHASVRDAIRRMDIEYHCDKSVIWFYVAKRDGISEKMKNNKYAIGNHRKKVERIIVKCDFCGRELERLPCKMIYKHHFCNSSCRAKYTGQVIVQTIEYKEKHRQISLKNGNKPPLHIGEDHWNWKGGIGKQNRGKDGEYIKWRKAIFSKFNYICQECGVRGGCLSAHHIKPWAEYPELRYDIENGICLCYDCHMELHGLKKKTA